jgi:HSP20 family protein
MATSHHPLRGFLDLMSEMERVRNLGRHGYESHQEQAVRTHATAWVPTADVVASGEDLVISLEIPGVRPEDIDLSVSEGVLTVSGERPGAEDAEGDVPYVRERYLGSFRRAMVLPEGADASQIRADFDHGVVTITVPDAAHLTGPAPQRIEITERTQS